MKFLQKVALALFILSFAVQAFPQNNQFNCIESEITFFSKAPLENIKAKNSKAELVINADEIIAKVPIKAFQFKKKLMQKHFNENYMESDEFPVARLTGKWKQPLETRVRNTIIGELTIHGVSKDVTIPVEVEKLANDHFNIQGEFYIKPKDHDIKIPKLMFRNIADKIKVNVQFKMKRNEN